MATDSLTDKNGRPLTGAALAARLVRQARQPRQTVEAAEAEAVELPFARHRGGAEAPPWRR